MREAQKLQDGRTTQPRKSRPSVRHDQPPRVRAQRWDRNKKRPEQPAHPMRSAPRDGEAAQGHEARRSGQLVRVTGRPHTGEKWKACHDEAALVGGDRKHASRQACSRSHYQTGRVRLPGGSGLDGTDQPGRRRADARYVGRRASFGSLRNEMNRTLDLPRPLQLGRPVRRKPADDLVILFDGKSLSLADPQEEPTIGSTEAPDRGFVQLTCLAVGGDQAEKM